MSNFGSEGPSTLRVFVGKDQYSTMSCEIRLVEKTKQGVVYLERWRVWGHPQAHNKTFECYDDRRQQQISQGHPFGLVEVDDDQYLRVWDASTSAE